MRVDLEGVPFYAIGFLLLMLLRDNPCGLPSPVCRHPQHRAKSWLALRSPSLFTLALYLGCQTCYNYLLLGWFVVKAVHRHQDASTIIIITRVVLLNRNLTDRAIAIGPRTLGTC